MPVIAALAERFDRHRKAQGNPSKGPIFASARGTPMSLDRLYWLQMREVFKKAGIRWRGWHGFRRGLAPNLNRLGIDDSVIQAILRHSNVAVTQACYIKTARPDAVEAMRKFAENLASVESRSLLVLKNGVSEPEGTIQ